MCDFRYTLKTNKLSSFISEDDCSIRLSEDAFDENDKLCFYTKHIKLLLLKFYSRAIIDNYKNQFRKRNCSNTDKKEKVMRFGNYKVSHYDEDDKRIYYYSNACLTEEAFDSDYSDTLLTRSRNGAKKMNKYAGSRYRSLALTMSGEYKYNNKLSNINSYRIILRLTLLDLIDNKKHKLVSLAHTSVRVERKDARNNNFIEKVKSIMMMGD